MDRRDFVKTLFGIPAEVVLTGPLLHLSEVVAAPGDKVRWKLQVFGVSIPLAVENVDDAMTAGYDLIQNMDWETIKHDDRFDPLDVFINLREVL